MSNDKQGAVNKPSTSVDGQITKKAAEQTHSILGSNASETSLAANGDNDANNNATKN